jgi:hypothetical protein
MNQGIKRNDENNCGKREEIGKWQSESKTLGSP